VAGVDGLHVLEQRRRRKTGQGKEREMHYGVLGTGMVGQAIATKLVALGHETKLGSRVAGNEKALAWVAAAGGLASEGSFADAAAFGELVFNCTSGAGALAAVEAAGAENLRGKVLVDVANPLDFSHGMPPSLSVCNTDSLGEQIQRALPEVRVVKSLNTMNCEVMVDPGLVPGDHAVFVCGDDPDAKAEASRLLGEFGWPQARIVDLGGIVAARGTEMFLPLWLALMGARGNARFNVAVVA
jgi:predicted dinucleotide-binding enzyme